MSKKALLVIIVSVLAFTQACSEQPDFFELGKQNYELGNYPLSKLQLESLTSDNPNYQEARVYLQKIDSIEKSMKAWFKKVEEEKALERKRSREKLLEKFAEAGIFGRWILTVDGTNGFKMTISFIEKENEYSEEILFSDGSIATKNLYKVNQAYFVQGSTTQEHYTIESNGNLKLWDMDGLVGTGISIMP